MHLITNHCYVFYVYIVYFDMVDREKDSLNIEIIDSETVDKCC